MKRNILTAAVRGTACKKSSASPSSLPSVYTRPNDAAVAESSTAPRQV